MTRNFSILAAAATVAFLAFAASQASAMNLGNRGGSQPGPTSHTSSASSGNLILHGCDDQVDMSELTGAARHDYLQRCPLPKRGF
jgi:Spy/CpxP family protein refolding chaperone